MPARFLDHEQERLAALRSYAILDTPTEQSFDDLAELAAAVCDAPIAWVALVDSDRVWFKAQRGIDLTEIPRDLALAAESMLSETSSSSRTSLPTSAIAPWRSPITASASSPAPR